MKIIISIILFFSSCLCYSQSEAGLAPRGPGNPFSGNTRIDYARILIPKPDYKIEGSVYAFERWDNKGLLQVDKSAYKLSNINFNMRTNSIEAKVGKDSVYIFDLANVEHAFINNRKFKSYYFAKDRKDRIFEQLHEDKEFDILIGYEVGVRKAEIDPTMVKKQVSKYFTTKTYYIKRGIDIKPLRLKKKEILPLFGSKSNDVAIFVKENKLSYKKDYDLKKIFSYFQNL